jgi:hypothetical protein
MSDADASCIGCWKASIPVEPYGADYHITLALREPPAFFAHGSQARAVMHSAGWCRVMVVCLFDSDNEDAAHYAYGARMS